MSFSEIAQSKYTLRTNDSGLLDVWKPFLFLWSSLYTLTRKGWIQVSEWGTTASGLFVVRRSKSTKIEPDAKNKSPSSPRKCAGNQFRTNWFHRSILCVLNADVTRPRHLWPSQWWPWLIELNKSVSHETSKYSSQLRFEGSTPVSECLRHFFFAHLSSFILYFYFTAFLHVCMP